MLRRYCLIGASVLVVGCASQPQVAQWTPEQMASIKPSCQSASQQIKLIEQQLSMQKFYTVNGVYGSTEPDRINKRYYTLARYKIWQIRTSCGQ